jgi:cytochrome b6-f complex iron-sulfur subunit
MPATPFNPELSPMKKQSGQPRLARADLSRRDFMNLAWKGVLVVCGLLGFGAMLRYLDYQNEPARQVRFDLGPAESFPLDSRTPIPEAQAVLIHSEDSFQALSTNCPHLGCTVEITAEGFACPCHGSKFGRLGELKTGPSTRPMEALRVEQDSSGHIILSIE